MIKSIALDTSAYSSFARGNSQIAGLVQQASYICIPFVVLGELRAGFLGGNQMQSNERNLMKFLNDQRVIILHSDDQTSHHYARIYILA
ncbi:hypothetical protein E4414_04155 [Leptospira interrogans]|nr:hypothetical protein E4414_04155 [Leptospira interrogans]QOI33711.1 type II toxin-antitoxin system VapC family toxin [Leptospira interrogans serovar Icterohaemorrhagiae]